MAAMKKTAGKPKPKITKVEKQIAKELSPAGVKKNAKKQSDALDKKYPGLYKNTTAAPKASSMSAKPKATAKPTAKATTKPKPKNPAAAFVQNERKVLAEEAAKARARKAAREAAIAATE